LFLVLSLLDVLRINSVKPPEQTTMPVALATEVVHSISPGNSVFVAEGREDRGGLPGRRPGVSMSQVLADDSE
jgi:hypothetical protein